MRKMKPPHPVTVQRQVKTAPAYVVKKTDQGLVLILSPETLFNKTAYELRESGFEIPQNVPPVAVVIRDSNGLLAFTWEESSE